MRLLKDHLYRVSLKEDSPLYNSYPRKCVLTVPSYDTEVGEYFNLSLNHSIGIDIAGSYSECSSIYLTSNSFKFEKPTVSDVLEIMNRMKKENSLYRYDLRTNKIIKK